MTELVGQNSTLGTLCFFRSSDDSMEEFKHWKHIKMWIYLDREAWQL